MRRSRKERPTHGKDDVHKDAGQGDDSIRPGVSRDEGEEDDENEN